jgi:hypothetical protein
VTTLSFASIFTENTTKLEVYANWVMTPNYAQNKNTVMNIADMLITSLRNGFIMRDTREFSARACSGIKKPATRTRKTPSFTKDVEMKVVLMELN